MFQETAPVRPVRSFNLALLGLAVAAATGLLAWKLVTEEDTLPDRREEHAQSPAPVTFVSTESAPTTAPTAGDTPEPLAVAPEPGAIRGKVTDHGGIAVNHGTVRIVLKVPPGQRNFALVGKFDQTMPVNEEGCFSVVVPGGGIYQVVAEAEGFAPAIKDGVKPGDEIELVLDVGASIAGIVVDKLTGKAIEGAAVETSVEKGATVRKATTSATGEFSVKDLPAGKLVVGVEHALYVPRSGIDHVLQAGEASTLRIEMDPGKSIKGQVLSADDGSYVEGATVTVRKKKVSTDSTGRFHMRGLEPETHDVQVAADGFQSDQRSINLSGSRVEAVAEIMLNRGATIRGRIQNEKLEPVVGAELRLFETWDDWSYEDWMTRHLNVKTGEDGTFKMTGIPAREWLTLSLRVKAQGYPETFEKGIKVAKNDDEVFLAITLRQGAVISGRVLDQENRPVTGARMELRLQGHESWFVSGDDPNITVSGTDAAGEFKFEALGFNKYSLSAQARGFSTSRKNDIDLTGGGSLTNVLLTVEGGAPVKGFVVDGDEKPVAGANVNIWTGKGNGQAVSDKDGKFVVESVPKGPWDVYAWAVGYANTRLSKQLPNSDAGLRIVLKREGVLKGTVIDEATKKPVEKFRAYLHSEDGRPGGGGWRQPRWSGNDGDPEGKFQIQAPPGTYRLEIVAQGYVRGKKDGIVIQAGTDPEPVKMELKRGGAIEGIVRAENGQPAPWVQVYVGRDDGSGAFSSHGFSENDGYFFVGDLDSGTYTAMFQQHEAPLLIQSGVFVGGDRPAFLDAQIQTVAVVTFDFVLERPKPAEDASKSGETVAGATSGTPPPKPWRPPRVRVWVESQDGTILGINHEWTGPDQQKFRPLTRKDLFVPQRKEKFSVGAKDLPAGRFVLRASAKGFVDVRMPFQVQQSVRWRMPVEMKLLPREQRPDTPDGPRLRTGFWIDQDGNRMEYRYYEDE